MSLLLTMARRPHTPRSFAPQLRWVDGEPVVLPTAPRGTSRPLHRRSRRVVWSTALFVLLSTLMLAYWRLAVGGSDQVGASAAPSDHDSLPSIRWIPVVAAPETTTPVLANVVESSASSTTLDVREPTPGSAMSTLPVSAPQQVNSELSESEFNQILNAKFAGRTIDGTPRGAATILGVRARLLNGYLLVEADVKVALLTLPVSLSATVGVDAGRPVVEVDAASVARTTVPYEVRASLQRIMQRFSDELLASEQVRLMSLTISNETLHATGVRT